MFLVGITTKGPIPIVERVAQVAARAGGLRTRKTAPKISGVFAALGNDDGALIYRLGMEKKSYFCPLVGLSFEVPAEASGINPCVRYA